jgi:lysozyme family protein
MNLFNPSFNEIINYTLDFEGGYVMNKSDPGGETNFGISKASFPKLDIKNLTKEEAQKIYFLNYFHPLNIEQIPNKNLRFKVFDMAVLCGTQTSIKNLQNCLNLITGRNISVDGILGSKTNLAIRAISNQEGLVWTFSKGYEDYLMNLASKKTLAQFREGWLKRARFLINV